MPASLGLWFLICKMTHFIPWLLSSLFLSSKFSVDGVEATNISAGYEVIKKVRLDFRAQILPLSTLYSTFAFQLKLSFRSTKNLNIWRSYESFHLWRSTNIYSVPTLRQVPLAQESWRDLENEACPCPQRAHTPTFAALCMCEGPWRSRDAAGGVTWTPMLKHWHNMEFIPNADSPTSGFSPTISVELSRSHMKFTYFLHFTKRGRNKGFWGLPRGSPCTVLSHRKGKEVWDSLVCQWLRADPFEAHSEEWKRNGQVEINAAQLLSIRPGKPIPKGHFFHCCSCL